MAGRQEVFQEAMNQGHSAAWDQRWEKAAEFYRQALEEIPDHHQGLINLGLALFELQQFDDSLKHYQRAAELKPDDPLPIEKVARIYERTGKLKHSVDAAMLAADLYLKTKDAEKAIENWTHIVQLMPEHLPAHSRLALMHERLARRPQAITEYIAVASLLQHEGKLEEAVQTVNHALKLNPNSKEAAQALEILKANNSLPKPVRTHGVTGPLRMARVREMDDTQEIAVNGKETRSPDPIAEARQKALTILAGMLFDSAESLGSGQQQDGGNGIRSLTRGVTGSLASSGPDTGKIARHLGRAIDLQTRGEDEKAAKELKNVIDEGMDHPAVFFNLGLILSRTQRKESAQRNLQRSVTHVDFAVAARLLIGEYLFEKGRAKDAAVEYLEALKVADSKVVPPEQADELSQLYEPLIESHARENDEKALEQVCRNIAQLLLRPNWRDHLKDARQQLPGGEIGPPMPLAEILTQAKSTQVVESMAHINQLARQGHFRSAMEVSYKVLDQAPTYLPLHVQMADLLLRQDRTQEAISKLTIVAQTYSARGESNRAKDLYNRIVELSPMDLAARSRLIDQLVTRGETEKAVSEYLKLADVYYRLAELEIARTTYQRALRLTQQANLDSKWAIQILHHMADIDLQRLDWRQAVRVFEQLRTLDPEDEKARANLIELNVRLGQESQGLAELDNYLSYLVGNARENRAVPFLEGLVKEISEVAFVRRRLAEALQQERRTKEAIEHWDKVGELMYDAGDLEGAKQAVRAILTMNPPNTDQYQTFLQKLESES